MCAISGLLSLHGAAVDAALLTRMSAVMRHRGPDGSAHHAWNVCALAHERLSIIDVAGGRQPILNEDGSCGIVVNGEIYNYLELSRELQKRGHQFRTHSDSETILHGYEEWGCDFFQRLDGMFAFAIWDGRARQVVLGRDGLGKKPLAFAWLGKEAFGFASDIRALAAHPAFDASLRPEGLADYLQYRCVSEPESIYRHVQKVLPGHWMIVSADGQFQQGCHWRLPAAAPTGMDYEEAKGELRRLVRAAVSKRLMSEVPLGILLSGGIDSSIVAAEAAVLSGDIRTFTLGFEGSDDERDVARRTAAQLGTRHEESVLPLDAEQNLAIAEAAYDEPFADSSSVATAAICAAARKHVTVVLNGDGGDESFAGYNHFRMFARTVLEGESRSLSTWERIGLKCAGLLPSGMRRKMKGVLRPFELARDYPNRFERWRSLHQVFSPAESGLLALGREITGGGEHSIFSMTDAEADDYSHYLASDLLVKMDRASMNASLEARSPLLDKDIIRFARGLPLEWKVTSAGAGKRIVRDAYAGVLPEFLWKQPKRGFQSPVKKWLRQGSMNELARRLAESSDVRIWSHLDGSRGRLVVRRFLRGAGNEQQVWSLLMLERWMNQSR